MGVTCFRAGCPERAKSRAPTGFLPPPTQTETVHRSLACLSCFWNLVPLRLQFVFPGRERVGAKEGDVQNTGSFGTPRSKAGQRPIGSNSQLGTFHDDLGRRCSIHSDDVMKQNVGDTPPLLYRWRRLGRARRARMRCCVGLTVSLRRAAGDGRFYCRSPIHAECVKGARDAAEGSAKVTGSTHVCLAGGLRAGWQTHLHAGKRFETHLSTRSGWFYAMAGVRDSNPQGLLQWLCLPSSNLLYQHSNGRQRQGSLHVCVKV